MPGASRLLLIVGLLSSQALHAAGTLEVTVLRQRVSGGAFFEVHASGFAHASIEHAWQLLTDYERQSDYVPNLTSAKIISRNGNEVTLDQDGRGGFFFFKRPVHLHVHIVETPKLTIDVALLSGDMKRYTAHWQLTAVDVGGDGGTRIDYGGNLEPDFFVPPLIGNAILQNDVRKMMMAVIDEIEK